MKIDTLLIIAFIAILGLGFCTAEQKVKSKKVVKEVAETVQFYSTNTPEYRRTRQEAIDWYDKKMNGGIPNGLVLPNGMTVEEFDRSGQSYGK
jgi:ABC-type glycerol-3-phosphate transport system substrate-binding protein